MDTGQLQVGGLREHLATSDQLVWVRAVGGPIEDGAAPLWHVEAVVGPLSFPERQLWRYQDCTFVSTVMSAIDFAEALPSESGQVAVGGVNFTLELLAQSHWQRRPCFGQYDEPRLPYASVLHTANISTPQMQIQTPNGFLVAPGAPAFAAFAAAYRAFFTGNFAFSGAQTPRLGEINVHICDARGRITKVDIQSTGLDVRAEGTQVGEAQIELMAPRDRTSVPVEVGGVTKLLLPNGLPDDSWLWLRVEDDWLDYRWFEAHLPGQNQDVSDMRSADPDFDLGALIAQGEGQYVEFKAQLPTSTVEARRTALKTIVAFANGEGGTVLYGVGDDGAVIGLFGVDVRTLDKFNDILRKWTNPMPACECRVESLDGKSVLLVEVSASSGTIHALTVESDRPEFFVRRGATTFHAHPDELQRIMTETATHANRGNWRLGIL
ncbi:MAG: helix-turn-helix domain-containing protein [Acidimicrobiales bacterium]